MVAAVVVAVVVIVLVAVPVTSIVARRTSIASRSPRSGAYADWGLAADGTRAGSGLRAHVANFDTWTGVRAVDETVVSVHVGRRFEL